MQRYRDWMVGKSFTDEQREWLDRMAQHIGNSLSLAPEDFESGWFGQQGSLGRVHALFGSSLQPLIDDLNDRLAA